MPLFCQSVFFFISYVLCVPDSFTKYILSLKGYLTLKLLSFLVVQRLQFLDRTTFYVSVAVS